MLKAARELQKDERIVFVLCGEGPAKSRLEKAANGISNVVFVPLQPKDRLNELLNMADIHILPQKGGVEDLVMPSKLTNMLSSGRPVVATADAGTQIEVIVRECGVVVKPGDIIGVRNAITALVNDSEKRDKLGMAGRKYAEENWQKDILISEAFSEWS